MLDTTHVQSAEQISNTPRRADRGLKMEVPWAASDVTTELCERKLRLFLPQAWAAIEPEPFVANWHIDAICDHLQAVTEGQIRHLMINVPPRYTKSMSTSVCWPAWEWGPAGKPETRWLFNSYAQDLSLRDSLKCRTLIQSNWYQKRWGGRFTLTGDQNAKERYNNSAGGYRIATSVGGVGTGEGGDRFVIDDPHNVKTVGSDVVREGTIYWWRTVVPTRLDDPKKSSFVIIMQRSHDKDLAGYIRETLQDLTCLILPAEFDPRSRCVTPLMKDPRRKIGDLLWPGRFDRKEIENLKRTLGSYAASAQLQQRPAPAEGGIFKRTWWRTYQEPPKQFDFVIQSWDMSFKALRDSDSVAGQVWGILGADRYLLDRVNEQLTFTETLTAVRNLTERWPDAVAKYVEDKANGTAVIDTLKREIPGLIAVNPTESKESRAFAVSPEVEAGNVWLPDPRRCPWVETFIEQLSRFPRGTHDDDVDACTQALLLARRRAGHLRDLAPVVGTRKDGMLGVGAYVGRRN